MSVEVFKADLTLESPAIISAKGAERGMIYTSPKPLIYGSTLHGALSRAVLGRRNVDVERALNTYVTTLCPFSAGQRLLYLDVTVAHAMSFRGKGDFKRYVFSTGLLNLLRRVEQGSKDLGEALVECTGAFMEELERKIAERGLYHAINPADIKPARGQPVESEGGLWRAVSVRRGVYLENAVDRARGSVWLGALYGYEYIEPGTAFTGLVGCPENRGLCGELAGFRELVVYVGRGQGRGFGKAKLSLRGLEPRELERLCPLGEELFIASAVAPTYIYEAPPRPLLPGDVLETLSGLKLKVLAVIGGEVETYTGWSRLRHSPKLVFECNAPGSLLVLKTLEGKVDSTSCLEIMLGMFKGSIPGFNAMHPLAWRGREDPLRVDLDRLLGAVARGSR
jgi:hypothetical protein